MKRARKSKHNKKRNTAFLYEVLIQDITKSVMNGDADRQKRAVSICKEFFGKQSMLHEERELYSALLDIDDLDGSLVEKLLAEVKSSYAALDQRAIFNTQTRMIAQVNRHLSPSVFNNFVSNYKSLATIAQILNQQIPIKKRLVLESNFLEEAKKPLRAATSELQPTDNLVYRTFIKNYNTKYASHLLPEQREVVTRYATSFSDNGLSLKCYLNEELGRLRVALEKSLDTSIMKEDKSMLVKTQQVLEMVASYKDSPYDFDVGRVVQILEIQNLVKEIER